MEATAYSIAVGQEGAFVLLQNQKMVSVLRGEWV